MLKRLIRFEEIDTLNCLKRFKAALLPVYGCFAKVFPKIVYIKLLEFFQCNVKDSYVAEVEPEKAEDQKVVEKLWKPDKKSWPLLERIDFVSKSNRLHSSNYGCNLCFCDAKAVRPCIRITPESFSYEILLDVISGLPVNGGDIYLPSGRIYLEKELVLKSGIRLSGTLNSTELIFNNSEYGIVIKGTQDDLISHVHLENLKIGHPGHHNFCAAVFLTHSTDICFKNIDISAPRAVGFLFSDKVYNTKAVRCEVKNAGLVGFMMIRDVKYTILDSCTAQECQQSGVFLTDLKLPADVDPLDFDAQIHYTSQVIGNFGPFDPKDPSPCNTTFTNCCFCENRKMGITTDGVGCLRVINCIISDNDCEGITIDNGSWNCVIQNSYIYGNGWRGLQEKVELNNDFVDEMGLMMDGSSKAKLPGISFDNAAFCRVENNRK